MAASRSIIFFADGSQETHTGLRRILHAQTAGSLLSRFLDRVKCALQEEVARVPPVDRNGLPDFHNLYDLVQDNFDESTRHPALHPTEIVLVQLGHFIARYERADEPYPNATENVVVGVCFGELSAAAVSLAKSLVELIPLAVDSVRLAFRAGIAASVVGNGLERRTQPAQCWSTTVSRDCGLADEGKLDALGEQLGIPEHRRPYITAFSRKTITIGGPPSSLRRLLNYLRETGNGASLGTSRDIRIYAPYHAFRYFSREDVRRLVDGPVPSGDSFNDGVWQGQSRTFIGAATGKYYTATSRRELLEDVMYNILAQPIRWEEVVTACKLATEESKVSAWMVRPFAQSSLAKSLTSSLRAITDIQLTFDDAFGLQTTQTPRARHFPIAIVGMAGRFPKADDPDALWEVLKAGLDCHTEIPVDRFDPRTHLSQPAYGCFLDRPGMFDARFFNMSPREALQTDPGQRLALVTAYEALEMAGFVPNRTPSTQLDRVGTFNGQVADEYKEQNLAQEVGTYFIPGTMRAFATGRINHFFKFGGPAVSLDTACSTSSVALHMACNAIWSGECDTAVVGGMNIISSSDNYVGLSAGHFISPTGGCKTWDKDADGYCRGEAVASVVLKPLEAAQADNDNVLGVILSFATNYSANADSITRPHAPTQESLYRTALRDAGLRPFDVDYIEMHGTGTQAGDTVEMNSVCNVFAPTSPVRPPDNPLYVGAVKANVGHGESASGITGLIKTLLVLRKQQLPPHVGIKTAINPKLPDLQKRNVHIPFHQTPLPSKRGQGSKRRILLNNFSAAGGNTACILEEPPERSIDSSRLDRRSHHVVTISGKSVTSVLNNARNLMAYLAEWPDVSLSDLSYTTTARRMHHPLRQAFVASSIAHLTEQLSAFLSTPNPTWPKKLSRVAFCFTGQGSFYMPMARDLFEHSSQFRQDLLRFDRVSREHCFATFLPVVDGSGADSTVTEVQKQLAIVAVEMALFRFFESLDISPSLVIGHSLGEYAALYAAGVLSANDTLYLVGQRASLLETSCPLMTSGMLAVQGGENTIKHLREKYSALEIACINGPRDVVLSGPRELCEAAMTQLRSQGVHCQLLAIPFAYHSSQMERILDRFEQMATAVHFEKPKVPLVSPSTETVVHEAGIIGPSYLRDQTRRCVRFYGALLQCEQAGLVDENTVWLEIGPRPICMGMIKATLGSQVRLLPSLREGENDWAAISKSLASLHTWGYDINWQEYHREFEAGKRLLTLPRYAWDEKEYWVPYRNDWLLYKGARNERAQTALSPAGPNTTTVQKLISQEVEDRKVTLVFETDLAESKMHAMITGHVINGSGLCPASVYADIALTIADYIRKNYPVEGPSSGISVGPMQILHPITLPRVFPQERKLLRMRAVADLATGKGTVEFGLDSRERGNDEPNAKCSIQYAESNAWLAKWSQSSYLVRNRIDSLSRGITEGTTHRILRGMAYKLFSSLVEYDRKYQGMQEVLINTEELEAVATLQLYSGTDAGSFFCNPLWIDSLMHLSGFIMNATDALDSRGAVFISHGWESFRLAREIDPSRTYRVHVKMQPLQGTVYAGNATIFDADTKIGMVKGLKFQQVPRSLLDTLLPPNQSSRQSRPPQTTSAAAAAAVSPPLQSLTTSSAKRPPAQQETSRQWDEVINIIANETGVPASQISDDSDLSALGIDSLLSLTILSRLRERLQIDLPQTLFEDCSTIHDLQHYFSTLTGPSSRDSTPSSESILTPQTDDPESLSSVRDTEPTDKTSHLRSLIARELGIDVEELLAADDLSAVGIDSLMALTIAGAVREQLGIAVPPEILTAGSSMTDIERSLQLSSAPVSSAPMQPSRSPSVPLSVLLQGDPKATQKYLFLFPDGSGSASSYAKLPEIGSGWCVFGLNSPFLRAGRDVTFSVDDLVQTWVKELRARQPKGPYILGGWSAGGYYAFEAAKVLMRAGEEVRKLILIDVPPRNVYEAMPVEVLRWLARHNVMGDGAPAPAWLVEHFESTLAAVDRYRPTAMEGQVPEVYLVWASDGVVSDSEDAAGLDLGVKVTGFLLRRREDFGGNGWERLLPGSKIFVAKAPGSHFSMVMAPNAAEMSRLIAAAVTDDASGRYSAL